MANIIEELAAKNLIQPPAFVRGGTEYLTITGSVAYAVSSDTSDMDVYGFCIPPKDLVFPHLRGEIPGFGFQTERFEQYSQHHIKDNGKEYDLTVFSIVKFFQLCMQNNPNMIDSLFTPENCVLHATDLSRHVRDNRKLFLHKGSWHKFKGYAYGQLKDIKTKKPQPESKRYESVQKFGFDVKFAYHVVRLINEAEQILVEHDLDLTKNNEQLKAIRRGEWTLPQIEQYFSDKERDLETAYVNSTLRHKPDEAAIKTVLMECLEMRYGSLQGAVESQDHYKGLLRQIQQIVSKI